LRTFLALAALAALRDPGGSPPTRPGALRDAALGAARWAGATLTSPIRQPQSSIADAGSFTVLQGGSKIGKEVFTIHRMPPPDAGYLVEGAAVYLTHRLVPILRTDSSGTPVRYELDEFVGDHRQRQLTLEVVRGRGSERVQTSRGESATEFLVAPGARLLDDDVFAQYYFIARASIAASHDPGGSMVVPVLIPRRGGTVGAPIAILGDERVDVAGQSRDAVHLRIRGGEGEPRDVWADQEGRVLRVAIPARGIVALRDDVPF
jgi:hypothetical protein